MREYQNQLELPYIDRQDFQSLFLPYSDLRQRWTQERTHFQEIYGAFPLGRLSRIKTLSFLSYAGPDNKKVPSTAYNHDRLDHSLTVGIIAGEIAKRNLMVLPPESVIKLEIAGMLHDIATPAYGDPAKMVDPKALHEETNWRDLLTDKGRRFLAKYNTSPKEVDEMIRNRGTLGEILDIADRISYVMKDLYFAAGIPKESLDENPYQLDLRYLLSHNPDIGNIYKTVAVEPKTGKVVFTDADKLLVFLRLRAMLWKGLYMHPTSQSTDLLVTNLIKPLYDDGTIDAKKLRRIGDNELTNLLYKRYGEYFKSEYNVDWALRNWNSRWHKFRNPERAEKGARVVTNMGGTVLAIREISGFDAGLNYNVVVGNEIGEFGEIHPDAYLVKREQQAIKGTYLFYITEEDQGPLDNLARTLFK